MTDRPIIFSAPMVRALLEGRKTQTRRLINPQPVQFKLSDETLAPVGLIHVEGEAVPRVSVGRVLTAQKVRYAVGDRLYVRETWRAGNALNKVKPRDMPPGPHSPPIRYEADDNNGFDDWYGKTRVAIHMPRWASRLTLTVTDVRVQRLNDIDDADAEAEGVAHHPDANLGWHVPGVDHPNKDFPVLSRTTPREMFAALWDMIHGSYAWLENPWVVAVTFKPETKNIDVAPAA